MKRALRQLPSAVAGLALASCVSSLSLAEPLAITFDDLPLNGTLAPSMTRVEVVHEVLAILKQRHVPAVYGFVNAKKLEDNSDGEKALRAWVAGGEPIGNHSYSHFDLSVVTSAVFLADVYRNEPVLAQYYKGGDWRWFRYPFLREGDTLEKRQAVRRALRARGYQTAQVTIDWEDYLWNSAFARCTEQQDAPSLAWLRTSYLELASAYIDADRQMAQLVFNHPINHVLLLHLGAFSSTILPDLLNLLQEKNFTLVTLDEAQKDPVFRSDPDAASKNGGTFLEQWMDARHLEYPPATAKPYKRLESVCRPAPG